MRSQSVYRLGQTHKGNFSSKSLVPLQWGQTFRLITYMLTRSLSARCFGTSGNYLDCCSAVLHT